MTRRGDCIQTFTGRQFWPLDPRPEDVAIEDIAHALSMTCRYRGHTICFYSVAEHSVFVSRAFHDPELALVALLHDAAEAYLVDVPRPLKKDLPGFAEMEAAVERAIAEHFGLHWPWPDAVKAVDNAILHDERVQVMAPGPEWNLPGEGLGVQLPAWPPSYAEKVFLSDFKKLAGAL